MSRLAVEDNSRMSLRIPAGEKAILLRAAAHRSDGFRPPIQLERCQGSDPGSGTSGTLRAKQPARLGGTGEPAQAEREAAGRGKVVAKAEMSITAWHEEPIGKRHDCAAFDCGETTLTEFLRRYGQLLLAAGKRCLLASAEVGGLAILIDAKNARVAAWYASYGALPLLDAPLSMLLPLRTVEAALKAARR